jgi:hypothetical protein
MIGLFHLYQNLLLTVPAAKQYIQSLFVQYVVITNDATRAWFEHFLNGYTGAKYSIDREH